MLTLPPSASVLRPDPGPARDWVRNELAKPEYQQSLLVRITHWFWGKVGDLINAAASVGRLSPLVALGLLVVLVVGLAVVLGRMRREPRTRAKQHAVLGDSRTTAAQYRARAGTALTEERWDAAVLDGMRAIASGLAERALIDDLPSATADEIAAAASDVFAEEQPRLAAAARLFDDVLYGDQHATRSSASDLLDLERALRNLRPRSRGGVTTGMAVPR